MNKFNFNKIKQYIFIFLTATIFLSNLISKSLADEDIFVVENIKIEGIFDVNFSRDKFIDKGINRSFTNLMSKILLSKDIGKVDNLNLKSIKNFIDSFQILEEQYIENKYIVNFTVRFNRDKVKKFLRKKNISFSQPENIKVVFFPVFFINDEMSNFSENFFYNEWTSVEIENELISYILPLEDLDDISKILEMKNKIEELEVDSFVNKYDIKNYVFALIDYENKKLNIHLKTNFNNKKISKNVSYELKNINDKLVLNSILKDLKIKIADIWKEENLINLLMPLSIKLKFQHTNLDDLDKLRNTFYKISIIDNYVLEEFNINNSFFKIYYYGDPKKLRSELLRFGYQLENNQGHWQLYSNE